MTTRKKTKKVVRAPRSDEYKKDAVKLADTVGVAAAAKQLGIHTAESVFMFDQNDCSLCSGIRRGILRN